MDEEEKSMARYKPGATAGLGVTAHLECTGNVAAIDSGTAEFRAQYINLHYRIFIVVTPYVYHMFVGRGA